MTENTEVYRDLQIYGDELVSLVWWLEREFGLKSNIDPFKYAPREFPFFRTFHAMRKIIGLAPQYKSLKIRDTVSAVEAERWPDDASS